MDRDEAKRIVKENLYDYLRRKGIDADRKKKFHCLNASSPEHKRGDKHASMYVYRSKQSGLVCYCPVCKAQYDIFDLIGIDYGLTGKAKFDKGYEIYGIEIQNNVKNEHKEHRATMTTQSALHNETYTINLTQEMNEAHENLLKNIKPLAYLQSRGLSMDIIKQYKIGYNKDGYNAMMKNYPKHQTKGRKQALYRLFFPYIDEAGACSYFISEIADRSQVDEYNGKYRKINKGETDLEAQLFNERYLKKDQPPVVFLCEGIYDALSVEDVGGKAIAFSGVGNSRRFIDLCEKYKPKTKFIISLDNDPAGQEATKAVKEGLDRLGISYKVQTAQGGKDFNDVLKADREGLRQLVESIINEDENEEREAYLQTSVDHYLTNFVEEIEAEKDQSFFPTGFCSFDQMIDGGFYKGLYIVGAISSLGKTTFMLQCMDHIAESGNDVLIFSLEISKKELMAKSISRHTMIVSQREENGSTQYAKTTRGILTGSRYETYSVREREIIDMALIDYGTYASRIFIHEGIGDIGVNKVREEIDKHIRYTGRRPVVLIDYVQILAPYNDRATDKQNTDKAVLELKRMSRDFGIPIIGISSFNRESYTDPVTMAAFKESGAIEYTSDCLIALQYDGMDYRDREKPEERRRRVRDLLEEQAANGRSGQAQRIQVKILKQRNGSKGNAYLDFYPMFNRFVEAMHEEDVDPLEIPL